MKKVILSLVLLISAVNVFALTVEVVNNSGFTEVKAACSNSHRNQSLSYVLIHDKTSVTCPLDAWHGDDKIHISYRQGKEIVLCTLASVRSTPRNGKARIEVADLESVSTYNSTKNFSSKLGMAVNCTVQKIAKADQ